MDADQDLRSTVDALMDGSEVIVEVCTPVEARHGGEFGGTGTDAPSADRAASALVPYARAELTLRLHPQQDPGEAQGALVAHSEAPRPFGIPLPAAPGDTALGFEPATGGPAHRAALTALGEGCGAEPDFAAGGGSDSMCALHAPTERVLFSELRGGGLAEAAFLREYAAAFGGES
ncbi:hypothetical protein [Streptomyces violascens]|uniref:Peptidase n=1 Tax=Streptomyces violascens TaxID=67381 RepID=A0ABQ3QXV6_9ACTN|nr:hypothetical protein [Streptomyces violascens]GGU18466.1 peptidase [Streptomyces violascens]GHI42110.1 peptidase [Streptomyces violascens]